MPTGIIKEVKPQRKSVWIERKGKPDLWGAIDNAHRSINIAGCLTLNEGDEVSFEEGTDARGRETALNIKLTRGSTMAQNQNQNQNQGQNQGQKQQNQKQPVLPRVFVDFPDDNQILSEGSKGKHIIKVRLGQSTDNPQIAIRTKVFLVNGDKRWQVKSVNVETPQDVTLDEVSLDLTQPVFVEVEKAGYADSKEGKDRVQVPTDSVKKSAPKTSLKRIASKFVSFATPGSPNYIEVFKKDENGNPVGGNIRVVLGQTGKINNDVVTGFKDVTVNNTGVETLAITLDERDAVVVITDECGESTKEFLKKS